MSDNGEGNDLTGVAWHYVPGALVRHPGQAGWGVGQIQSSVGHRVTVNFEHAGKRMIDARVVKLEVIDGAG